MPLLRLMKIFLLPFLVGLPASGEDCSKTLTLGWTSIPPVFYVDEAGTLAGIDMDIARAVLGAAGCDFVTREMPFKRYMASLRFGQVDMLMSASTSEERRRFGHFSMPYRRERMVLFVRADDQLGLQIRDIEALKASDMRLVAGLGMWLGLEFADASDGDPAFRRRVLRVEGYPQMVRALAAGRVDGVIGDSNAIAYVAQVLGLTGQVVEAPLVVHDNDVHFMFSKKTVSKADVARIDAVLADFIGSPEHLAILRKYHIGEPEKLLPKRRQ